MNLIEQLGGYERAKHEFEMIKEMKPIYPGEIETNDRLLLDYRRQHNIFEVGDKVVKTNPKLKFEFVREVKGVFKDGSVWLDYVGYKWKYPKVRHATDEEIKAGKRLEVNDGSI